MTETQPMHIVSAIVAITGALAKDGITKGRKNQQQGYSFRGIEDVYAALAPLLVDHKVAIIPKITERIETERQSKSGGSLYSVVVRGHFLLLSAVDGSSVTAELWGEAMDSGDKATNKAMSAAYKYMAFMTFCIPTEGVIDDADHDTPPPTRAAAKTAAAPAKTVAAFDLAEDAVAALGRAANAAQFKAVGAMIAESKFTGEDAKMVQNAWNERKAELQEATRA